jgi:short subunit dehydrogenase-like uncharacterized protein
MNTKAYDIVVFGATGFVGKLLCRHLASRGSSSGLKWAAAARSREKLEALRHFLGPEANDLPLLIADAQEEKSLADMCAQAQVVISTVGPYALYGEPLIKVCSELGTDYCDLTGEPQWIRRMLDRYEASAKASGARIVHCCGFDSIPSDLGVHFLQKHALQRFGRYCTHIKMRVRNMRGGVSGGTVASLMNAVKEAAEDPAVRKALLNPYLLCPLENRPNTRQRSLSRPQYDGAFGAWLAPFVMAGVNTKVVFRSNALLNYAYGSDFQYDEAMLAGAGPRGRFKAYAIGGALGGFITMAAITPARWALTHFLVPAPGEGPSPQAQRNGFYDLHFVGLLGDGRTVSAKLTGDADPGYGSTSKMLGEAAHCLALGRKDGKPGGFWTPATLLGDTLIEALQTKAGLSFEVLEG